MTRVSGPVPVVGEGSRVKTRSERTSIDKLNREFGRLHSRSRRLIERIAVESLYRDSSAENYTLSPGALLLKSAGVVEQTCGGLTSNLWDDPFEWTLPETLSTIESVREYLAEVETTRKNAFACVSKDGELLKKIATPSGEIRTLIVLLLDTLVRAMTLQARAIDQMARASSDSFSILRNRR
jgi:hypothetical protein